MQWFDNILTLSDLGTYGKKTRKKLAQMKNLISFQNTFIKLYTDAMERYRFKGLPETVNERIILMSLITECNICFFEDKDSLLALPAAPNGALTVYGEPARGFVFSKNGMINKDIPLFVHGSDVDTFLGRTNTDPERRDVKGKGVIVWENKMRYPFINYVMDFADKISDTYRAIDVARNNLKNPFVIVAEESVIPTVKKFMEERDNNYEYILSSGVFPTDKIQLLPIQAQASTLSDCVELHDWYENKWREICGYQSNSQIDKKGENLIADEVHINDEYEQIMVNKCVDTINEYLQDVNKIFGVNIECEVKDNAVDTERDTNERPLSVSGDNSVGSESGN